MEYDAARRLFIAAEFDDREGAVTPAALEARVHATRPVTDVVNAAVAAGLRRGGHVLDLGTGVGAFAFALAAYRPDVQVTGLDIAERAVAAANAAAAARGVTNARFAVGDFVAAPLPRADAVMVTYALSLVDDPAAAFRNVAAALPPHGRFVVFDGVLPNAPREAGPLPPARLDALGTQAGFTLAARTDVTPLVARLTATGAWPWTSAPSAEARFVVSAFARGPQG